MKATLWLLVFGLFVSCGVRAQTLTDPLLQTCGGATDGASTTPWIQCTSGIKFVPVSPDVLVATGSFSSGSWRKFSDLPGEAEVAVCPAGAMLESETRCRTADLSGWATRFVRKDSLPGISTWQITFRWQPVTQYDDGTPITTSVIYVVTWHGTDAAGSANTPSTDEETAGSPLVLTVPQQRICAVVRARVSGVLSDPSQEVCIAPQARKPGIPAGVTVEFGSP